jgi:hypothetical protein
LQRAEPGAAKPLVLLEDPRVEIVPLEKIGGILSEDQQRFRGAWLSSLQKKN